MRSQGKCKENVHDEQENEAEFQIAGWMNNEWTERCDWLVERRKKMFYLTMHSTQFYVVIWCQTYGNG